MKVPISHLIQFDAITISTFLIYVIMKVLIDRRGPQPAVLCCFQSNFWRLSTMSQYMVHWDAEYPTRYAIYLLHTQFSMCPHKRWPFDSDLNTIRINECHKNEAHTADDMQPSREMANKRLRSKRVRHIGRVRCFVRVVDRMQNGRNRIHVPRRFVHTL